MRVLYIAEIIGKAGVWCVKRSLPSVVKEKNIDAVIANGDGATGGYGIGKNHASYLRKLGIDVLTGGDCVFYKKDLVEDMRRSSKILRAANFPPDSPGRGWKILDVGASKLAVVSILGQTGFTRIHGENPFTAAPCLLERIKRETNKIVIDFHAATTAEKQAFFFAADGTVSAIIGSHGRAQTSDERILPKGTAVICDAGRTGSLNSVGGMDGTSKIHEYLSGIAECPKDTWDRLEFQGVIIDIGGDGKAAHIERLRLAVQDAPVGENI